MVGFIKGLFSSKPKSEENNRSESEVTPSTEAKLRQPSVRQSAFFLDDNDAKTLGNVEYMKASRTVRRTFPKTASEPEEKETIMTISAMQRTIANNGSLVVSEPGATPTLKVEAPKVDGAAERRRTDTSMDMFRNMARDIKKK